MAMGMCEVGLCKVSSIIPRSILLMCTMRCSSSSRISIATPPITCGFLVLVCRSICAFDVITLHPLSLQLCSYAMCVSCIDAMCIFASMKHFYYRVFGPAYCAIVWIECYYAQGSTSFPHTNNLRRWLAFVGYSFFQFPCSFLIVVLYCFLAGSGLRGVISFCSVPVMLFVMIFRVALFLFVQLEVFFLQCKGFVITKG